MNLYLCLKTLHILSSTLLFGTGLGSAYYALRAWRTGNVLVICTTFRHLVVADWLFTATTGIFQPLSGIALMYIAGWPWQQHWLVWTFALYAIAGVSWLPVVWLQIRVHKMAAQALRDGTPMPMRATQYMRWWFALGWPAFIALLGVFYLMVAKPA